MTSAELAILSLIVQEPRYGYQVEKVIEQRGMREWAEIGFSSIYYLLGKLEKKKWITGKTGQGDSAGPARKIYHATKRGVAAWRRGTLDVLSSPRRYCTPLQVGLANLPGLAAEETIAALSQYCECLERRKAHVEKNWERIGARKHVPWQAEFMFDLSVTMTQAELSWIKKLIRTLARRQEGKCDG